MTATTRPDSAAEIKEIEQLLTPWLNIAAYNAQYFGLLGTCAPYGFDTFVKADGAPSEDAVALRAELLNRAEQALAALSEAGWQLTSYPSMEIDGQIIEAFLQTLTGELVRPPAQGMISLRMRFAVNRPR